MGEEETIIKTTTNANCEFEIPAKKSSTKGAHTKGSQAVEQADRDSLQTADDDHWVETDPA